MSAHRLFEALAPQRGSAEVRLARDLDAADWHWPRFERPVCAAMTDRERLGLPERYARGRLEIAIEAACAKLRKASDESLLDSLRSAALPLHVRIAAGQMLALAGDPRLCVDDPRMLDVPGGEVEIGLPWEDLDAVLARLEGLGLERDWIAKECPRHRVALRPFRLARHPVTHLEYRAFLLDSGHPALPGSWPLGRYPAAHANHPVHGVTAASAQAYADWLAARTHRQFRLPTEAEWEWAAAGPQGREFPWGDRFDPALANTAECGLFATTPVGAFVGGESVFGISDMAGNVEEYVADDYAPYPQGREIDDHLRRIHGRYRVARGGCFARFRDLARTRRRHGPNPRSPVYAMGFRLAESL
jgi:formylglycine-generating enzyme required for sulfatase activity